MDPDLLRGQGLDPAQPRIAYVKDMELRIAARAALVPKPGAVAYGMLIGLTQDEIFSLYSEESVAAYRPEAVLACTARGEAVPALCYNLPSVGTEPTNTAYAQRLREVGRKVGLPEEYLASLPQAQSD